MAALLAAAAGVVALRVGSGFHVDVAVGAVEERAERLAALFLCTPAVPAHHFV